MLGIRVRNSILKSLMSANSVFPKYARHHTANHARIRPDSLPCPLCHCRLMGRKKAKVWWVWWNVMAFCYKLRCPRWRFRLLLRPGGDTLFFRVAEIPGWIPFLLAASGHRGSEWVKSCDHSKLRWIWICYEIFLTSYENMQNKLNCIRREALTHPHETAVSNHITEVSRTQNFKKLEKSCFFTSGKPISSKCSKWISSDFRWCLTLQYVWYDRRTCGRFVIICSIEG